MTFLLDTHALFWHLFEPANNVFGQHADDQVAVFLQLYVLAPVAAIGVGILEVIVPIDLNGKVQGRRGQVDLDGNLWAERKSERLVEPEQPRGLVQRLELLVQKPLGRAAGAINLRGVARFWTQLANR